MGVLNVTPDSFSDGGRWLDPGTALAHGLEMAAAGAAVVDVGGESTRPGAEPVGEAEELLRVLADTGHRVLVGTSRKSFLGKLAGGAPDDRFEGSLATSAWAMIEGASMVRVHDVRPAAQAARLVGDAGDAS